VAIKVFRGQDDGFAEARRELEMNACMKKCNSVPKILAAGEGDHHAVTIMELMGPSLRDLWRFCDGSFSVKTMLLIMDQLIRGARQIHGNRIIHGDISPANIAIGAGKNSRKVGFLDLGLAKRLQQGPVEDSNGDDDGYISDQLTVTEIFASLNAHRGYGRS
jgi:serine/threonine protein kinase